MSRLGDYSDEMHGGELTDSNIERLLGGDLTAVSDESLRQLIASLSVREEPPRDVEHMATALAATARSSAPNAKRKGLGRLAVLASAGALVIALGGAAMASDGAVPGDPLYGMDRALEGFGIGAGGVDERIAEFDAVMNHGQEEEAYLLLAEVIEDSEGVDLEKAQRHLEMAATKSSPSAALAQQKVALIRTYIDAFKGPEDPIEGRAFGQGIADIARGKVDEVPGNSGSAPGKQADESPGNSENAPGQQADESPGSSGNAPVQREGDPGNSENAPGKQTDETPGNSENAPGKQTDESPGNSENAPGKQTDESPGNSENAPGQQADESPGNSENAPGRQ